MKQSISPEKAKLFSTLLVASLFMITVLTLSSLFTSHSLKRAEQQYFESLEKTIEGYQKIVSLQLTSYRNALHAFYVDEYFYNDDKEKIKEFFKKYSYKMDESFIGMYFMDLEGNAVLSSGTEIKMHVEKHPGALGKQKYYFSDFGKLPGTNIQTFAVEEAVYDNNKKLIGVIGASVKLDSFAQKILGIKLGTNDSFMIWDRLGYFLVHPRKDVIGLTYTPDSEEFKNTGTLALSKGKSSIVKTIDDAGRQMYLMTIRIPESSWTLAIKIPMTEIEKIYTPEKRQKLLLITFSFLLILLLVSLEAKVLDIFQKKQIIATVYDPLTNLWTRQRFEQEATKMLRNPHSKFMLIEADIRGFKFINQNYGEENADKLILFFSKTLNKNISEYNAIIGRGFADHFYILIKIHSVHQAMAKFKSIVDSYIDEAKNFEIPFFPKFGISFLMPGEKSKETTIQSLIGQASFAKSTIKDNMLTQYSIYNSKLLEKINEERFIESHMQQALDAHEFFVMYQPKISLSDDKIVGAEALVRWNSPKLGLMTPDKFIPLFERNGFITKLDYYVYEEVFKFVQTRLMKGEPIVPISVNMSRNHNKPEKFMHDFMDIFNRYSIPSNLIQLEILERSVMDNSTLQDITEKLHKEGFTVAMDDFGSGESSLNMLTKIPVDVLKFDREFLNASTDSEGRIDKKSEKFIHILVYLSKNLEKQTVFEGVETQAQRDFLRSIECDQAQGFFYSKPLSEQDFMQFIKLHS